jgi:undecaprenyl-diphosphatase
MFGVVEGVTEFLPISSTAHLIFTAKLLNLPSTDFQKSFEIAIQLGAILAVVVLYGRTLILDRETLQKVIVAFIPTAAVGFMFQKIIKNFFFESLPTILSAIFFGGIVIILFELLFKEKSTDAKTTQAVSYWQAFLIGCAQALSVVPGVSRAAATVLGGEAVGLTRRTAVDFSFLLAIPTMVAATSLDMFYSAGSFSSQNFVLLAVGFIVSFIVALLTIKWLLGFVKKHSFALFGVYRMCLAVLLWFVWS